MQKEVTVFAQEVISGNGVRHLRLYFEGVIYTPEACNLDDAHPQTTETKEAPASCEREAKGLRVFDSL